MFDRLNWKTKIWLASLLTGCVFVVPLIYLLPNGSTNPSDIGFWHAVYLAFIPGIPTAHYMIKWRQKYIDEHENIH